MAQTLTSRDHSPRQRRYDTAVLLIVGLACVAALARIPRLDAPPDMVFDEIYYAKAARQVLGAEEVTEERTHPPLSKLVIAAAMMVAGDRALGWRIASALAGTLLIGVVFALVATLFRDRAAAALAAALVALDGLVFVESRIAKPDIFLTLFVFASFAAFWRYVHGRLEHPEAPAGLGVSWLYLSGVAAGAAIATKWTALASLAAIPVMLAVLRGWGRVRLPRRDRWQVGIAYTVVPLIVYLLTYIPYFALGHSAMDFLRHQVSMYEFHASLTEGHPYQSPWWSWPLLIRPIWYEYREVLPQVSQGIIAIGNPIIWWASLPAFAWVTAGAVRRRQMPELFLLVGFAISYLPYAFIPRALFLYHFLPALPFLIIGLGLTLARAVSRGGSGVVLVILALAVGWFVAFYPVLSALPIEAPRYWRLMWFGSWI